MIDQELLLFIAFSSLAALAAIGFLLFLQPVHAALSFAMTVLSGAGLYLLLNAPYAAAATVIVYAGATIIIFLFALMFSQRSTLQVYDQKRANPVMSLLAVLAMAGILFYVLISDGHAPREAPSVESSVVAAHAALDMTAPPVVADLGRAMYTRYLWAIELAGAILLVATLGAIQIARGASTQDLQPESSNL